MRNLFLFLVLGNLGFAAWYFWYATPATSTDLARAPGVPSITLISELEEPPTPLATLEVIVSTAERLPEILTATPDLALEPAAASAPDSLDVQAGRCVSIGPFLRLDLFDGAMTILRGAGYTPAQHSENGEVWLGHWVYLENVTNQGQADTLSTVLAEHDVVDTYFDPSGADGDVLSLGLFRQFAGAELVRERVLDAGFEPVMVDRTRPGTLYWADLVIEADEEFDLEPLQAAGRIVRLEPRVCDEVEATSPSVADSDLLPASP